MWIQSLQGKHENNKNCFMPAPPSRWLWWSATGTLICPPWIFSATRLQPFARHWCRTCFSHPLLEYWSDWAQFRGWMPCSTTVVLKCILHYRHDHASCILNVCAFVLNLPHGNCKSQFIMRWVWCSCDGWSFCCRVKSLDLLSLTFDAGLGLFQRLGDSWISIFVH